MTQVDYQETINQYLPGPTGIFDGRQRTASAGTPVKLVPSPMTCRSVIVSPITVNTKEVVVGGASVVVATGARTGITLTASSPAVTIPISDLSKLYVDSLAVGEGVTFSAIL